MSNERPASLLPLTAADEAMYKAVADGAEVADGDIQRLAGLGLVVESPYISGQWVALDPRDALQRLLEAQQDALAKTVGQLALLPALEGLRVHFDPQRMYGGHASEFLPTVAQMDNRLGETSSRARVEVLSAQPYAPSRRDSGSRKLGSDRSIALLGRGVHVRLLYGGAAVADDATKEYVAAFTHAGGDVRVHRAAFPRVVIVDDRDAFVDDHVTRKGGSVSGWHISDRCAVSWARVTFDHLWAASCTWERALGWTASGLSERQLELLRFMDAGHDQPTVAKKAGVSLRLLAKELAAARGQLGLATTNQLMGWYGRWAASNEA
ncbi:phospholipase D family protein [Streptomyces sp. TBY4]|uniref:phospholipase D family protein n=1 Tax=Streptomyces sp. TBY4 TaxID=2962030 RepID=UPI0020B80576|nr:phospholipase D family protein [Streptomyces sp. TBY4]MCP3758232.1 phospholipase D family protein [Streptomyces sp. TBY4]